jgi:hypothetical protein
VFEDWPNSNDTSKDRYTVRAEVDLAQGLVLGIRYFLKFGTDVDVGMG